MRFWLSCLFFMCFGSALAVSTEDLTSKKLEHIRHQPEKLKAFLHDMPKGGELHYHLAGGAYPETMLGLAMKSDAYCVDLQNKMVQSKAECQGLPTSKLSKLSNSYQNIIQAWSMKGFKAGQESAHDHFFNSFFKFIPLVFDFRAELLASVMRRAASQHERYMELMILPDNGASISFAPIIKNLDNNEARQQALLANKGFKTNIQRTIAKTKAMHDKAYRLLHCRQNPSQPACQMTIRFQAYVLREQPFDSVFAQTLNAFEAANQSDLIVGVNLVQAEDGPLSLAHYREQMDIFSWFHKRYPNVHIALHAGELAKGLVGDEHLSFHIHDAINVAGASRIGHGTDILSETQADKIMADMRDKNIAVEINLTSNQTILGVEGQAHPLTTYLKHDVPVVLSTDDEGILRTNLTQEYEIAVLKHKLTYPELKEISFNAIRYAFLDDKTKQRLLNQLKEDFKEFEKNQLLEQNRNVPFWAI